MELVPDRWYIILEADEVPVGRPTRAVRHGVALAVWRGAGGDVHAAVDRCPHRSVSLALGRVRDGELECPFHGFRFRGSDGQCTHIPAHGDRAPPAGYAVPVRVVREAHGFIWLWEGTPREIYPPIPWFEDLDAPGWSWRAGRVAADWRTHWTRVVENQLDFTHLPFVHRTTIGRFITAAMEVEVHTDGADFIRTWVKDQEAGVLELHAPNLWRIRLGKKTWGLSAFVPVDEAQTRIYIRYYQRDVPWPVLRDLYGWLMGYANRFILAQDERVVQSHDPAPARLGDGEKLVPSDAPIIWFRRWVARGRASDAADAAGAGHGG